MTWLRVFVYSAGWALTMFVGWMVRQHGGDSHAQLTAGLVVGVLSGWVAQGIVRDVEGSNEE